MRTIECCRCMSRSPSSAPAFCAAACFIRIRSGDLPSTFFVSRRSMHSKWRCVGLQVSGRGVEAVDGAHRGGAAEPPRRC
eukprot:177960-Rhodomonas_salina.1